MTSMTRFQSQQKQPSKGRRRRRLQHIANNDDRMLKTTTTIRWLSKRKNLWGGTPPPPWTIQQWRWDAYEDNKKPTTTTTTRRQQEKRGNNWSKINIIAFSITISGENRGWIVTISCQGLFVFKYQNYEIKLVGIVVVSCQILKIMNYFVCCENVVFKNKTNKRIYYLWKDRLTVLIFIYPLHHVTIYHLYIAPLFILK